MRCIKLNPLTDRARELIRQYGDIWKVMDERPFLSQADRQYFRTSKPQLYIVPFEVTTPRNLGATWIDINNDQHFEYEETSTPKIKRVA